MYCRFPKNYFFDVEKDDSLVEFNELVDEELYRDIEEEYEETEDEILNEILDDERDDEYEYEYDDDSECEECFEELDDERKMFKVKKVKCACKVSKKPKCKKKEDAMDKYHGYESECEKEMYKDKHKEEKMMFDACDKEYMKSKKDKKSKASVNKGKCKCKCKCKCKKK